MQYSPVFKSSPHCLPSPDGKFIATLLPTHISIRAVGTLEIVRTIKLPADLAATITTFAWSATAERILLSANEEIHVYSAPGGDFHATIRNPSSAIAKLAFVDFGATDREVCVCSAHGIKLSLFNLASSKVVEISNPKFYTATAAGRGCSFRANTQHLALLTRNSGKDTVSIHGPDTREVHRSWSPDVVDAQGVSWTPDGKWLVMWESASQGHRVLFFTPEGHKYKDWCGPSRPAASDMHDRLGAGVKVVVFSPDSQHIAIGDYSRCISVLPMADMTDQWRLCHPLTIEPQDTLQVWQEQLDTARGQAPIRSFVRATQPVSPAARTLQNTQHTQHTQNTQELRTGPLFILFDCSAGLLAVALEDAPSTLWIWDISVCELRAVLMFHAEIARVEWHPTQSELLLIKCEGQDHDGVIFVWDPLSDGPRAVDFRSHLPAGRTSGRASAYWLKSAKGPPSIFFADSKSYLLGSVTDAEEDAPPWRSNRPTPAAHSRTLAAPSSDPVEESDADSSDMDGEASQLDDTFQFKKFGVD